jgi:uncharacterized protein (UPF0335 family)
MDASVAISGDQLRTIVERIENVEQEIRELAEAKKEIYVEANGNGFDVKILREVIRLRKQDPDERDEQESLIDVYLQAINQDNSTEAKKPPKMINGSSRARNGPGAAPDLPRFFGPRLA